VCVVQEEDEGRLPADHLAADLAGVMKV
jgi:hypothetical protein